MLQNTTETDGSPLTLQYILCIFISFFNDGQNKIHKTEDIGNSFSAYMRLGNNKT